MLGGERPLFCIIFKNHKLLEVEPFYHISEYKLDRKCFHMIFLGKDLPMEAGMMSKRRCMPNPIVVGLFDSTILVGGAKKPPPT